MSDKTFNWLRILPPWIGMGLMLTGFVLAGMSYPSRITAQEQSLERLIAKHDLDMRALDVRREADTLVLEKKLELLTRIDERLQAIQRSMTYIEERHRLENGVNRP